MNKCFQILSFKFGLAALGFFSTPSPSILVSGWILPTNINKHTCTKYETVKQQSPMLDRLGSAPRENGSESYKYLYQKPGSNQKGMNFMESRNGGESQRNLLVQTRVYSP